MSEVECIFCQVVSGQAEASVVFEDDIVVAFMDLNPVTRGHLLVVPRAHAVGLADLDAEAGLRAWKIGRQMAAAQRESLGAEGTNFLVCDGAAANQTVFHFHLHVIPRFTDDGWGFNIEPLKRSRSLLDADAATIRLSLTGG